MLTKLNINDLNKYKLYLFKRKCCNGYIDLFITEFINVKYIDEILDVYELPDTTNENKYNLISNILPKDKQKVIVLVQNRSKELNRRWIVAQYEDYKKWIVFLGYTIYHDFLAWIDISEL